MDGGERALRPFSFRGRGVKAGAFFPAFLPETLRDRNDVNLPSSTQRSFSLGGSAWEYPTFEKRRGVHTLKLAGTKTFESGVVELRYEPR